MTIQRMDHVGVVVEDLADAVAFFLELGLELQGETSVEGDWVGRIIALEDVHAQIAMLQTPDGNARLELVQFLEPSVEAGEPRAPSNTLGMRHVSFLVEDIAEVLTRIQPRGAELIGELVRYKDVYKLCYVRGPAGIIIELAEPLD